MSEHGDRSGDSPKPRRLAALIGLVAILALGAALRRNDLAQESVWLDEYFSLAHLDSPSLTDFLRDQRAENWEMTPLYYSLQYGWAHAVGASTVSIRGLSVVFGLAAIALAWLLGRRMTGPWGAWTAALLMALSPFHIFHAQGVRPYALVTLLALFSCYALLRFHASPHGGRWLALHLATNVALAWTHLFTLLLFVAQGVWLTVVAGLLTEPLLRPKTVSKGLRRIVFWTSGHALTLWPVLLWVATIRTVPSPEHEPPGLLRLPHMLFRLDGEPINWSLRSIEKIMEAGLSDDLMFLLMLRGPLQWCLVAALALGAALAAGGILKHRRKANDEWLLAALVFLLPPLMLFSLAHAWRPECFNARYVLYASPALYLLVGYGLERIPRRALRTALLLALALPMALQALLATQLPLRTDYLAAARHIRTHGAPDDKVFVTEWNVGRVLRFNMEDAGPVEHVSAEELLGEALDETPRAWVLLAEGEAAEGLRPRLEAWLDAHDVPFATRIFIGMRSLYLYRCGLSPPTGSARSG